MYIPVRSFHELGVISRTISMIAFWTLGAPWPPLVVTKPGRGRSFGRYGSTERKRTFHLALGGIADCKHRPLIRIGSL
jgi:hypothetical protein